jgi:uncharacterized protein YkwD
MAVFMRSRSLRQLLALTAFTSAAILLPTAAAHATAATCASARASVAAVSPRVVGDAVLCLVNRERTSRGLRALRRSTTLRTAAQRFSADMVAQRFFDHVSPAGSTVATRIRRAGYRRMATAGENIAWGTDELATPAAIVRSWMESPGHRAVILNGGFREGGVGVARGVPAAVGGADGATFVLDVGTRF